jgi:hypothetical protein
MNNQQLKCIEKSAWSFTYTHSEVGAASAEDIVLELVQEIRRLREALTAIAKEDTKTVTSRDYSGNRVLESVPGTLAELALAVLDGAGVSHKSTQTTTIDSALYDECMVINHYNNKHTTEKETQNAEVDYPFAD